MPPQTVEDGTAPIYKSTTLEMNVDRMTKHQWRAQQLIEKGEWNCKELNIRMRGIVPGDFNFILNSWMQSFRHAMKMVKNDPYFQGQQNLIAEIAKRRGLIVACDGDMPDYIMGYICGLSFENGSTLVDYVYVRQAYRKRGVAQMLLSAMGANVHAGITVTHLTEAVLPAIKAHGIEYNPYYNILGCSNV